MPGTTTFTTLEPGGDNALAVTLGILGDEWNLWILRSALLGARRYGDWIARGPISHAVLTARLGRLTEAGLFEKVAYQQQPVRHEYVLTARGRSVWTVLVSMWAWEQRWSADAEARLPRRRHTVCGQLFVPRLVCAACGAPADAHDVSVRTGPSGEWSRCVPAAAGRRRSGRAARTPDIVPHTMELVGNRWSAALLGSAHRGATRFGEFAEQMGAPPAVVTDRLRRFTELDVLAPRPHPGRADWVTYHLTDKGLAFFPVIACMIAWGQRWFHAPEGPALETVHLGCGAPFLPRLVCDRCDGTLHAATIAIEDVPDADG
ncbi:helix-turn-helix transcriptional regulator [Rhodococcus sp. CX]|uniref:winged helix-turn-helix transcriptional regulator n=1 Tax=Rhodococcus sp. CX TaxID=2789880 RepID=UPI0018CEC9F0|nr:helix-turn-helix domain-containing protein [Rhodococcus sp. CX]MBH0118154.1 helix-turn-helix transcriptional regulator [Rhodococcus sp. CX]